MKDLPAQDRPRERLMNLGAESLRNSELIAIILRTGARGSSAMDIAERLLQHFGSLEKLARAPLGDLQRVRGIGRDKAIALKSAFTLAQRMTQEVRMETLSFDQPQVVADYLREEARMRDVESMFVMLLNARHRLIRVERVSDGLLSQILIHPREVFRHAISANASAIVLAHNHPSGDPTPSDADIRATQDMVRAGRVLQIEVLDHIILGTRSNERPRDFVSLRELGVFQ
jgi:DNA repair protein RadC